MRGEFDEVHNFDCSLPSAKLKACTSELLVEGPHRVELLESQGRNEYHGVTVEGANRIAGHRTGSGVFFRGGANASERRNTYPAAKKDARSLRRAPRRKNLLDFTTRL